MTFKIYVTCVSLLTLLILLYSHVELVHHLNKCRTCPSEQDESWAFPAYDRSSDKCCSGFQKEFAKASIIYNVGVLRFKDNIILHLKLYVSYVQSIAQVLQQRTL